MATKTIKEIQAALKAAGFNPGEIDGWWGRESIKATKAFQAAKGLEVDGIVGPATIEALFPRTSRYEARPYVKPAWYAEAERLKGTRETPGAKSNPAILGWARGLGGWVAGFYKADSTPWCGLFVGHLLAATLPAERLPENPLSALAWRDFGVELKSPAIGAVLVFKRPGGGHVGLYAGEDAQAYHVLGGNQSDQVNVCRVAKSRCVAIRWPKTVSLPSSGGVALAGGGALSSNEA